MKFLILAIALLYASANASVINKIGAKKPVEADQDSKAEVIYCSTPGQKIPDPYDCTAFYLCASDLTPLHTYCQPLESFSRISLNCIYPYDASQCDTPGTNPPITTVIPNACNYVSEVHPHPYDCASYYICDIGFNPRFYHCGANLYYDPAYAGCNVYTRVACSAGSRPTPLPSAYPYPSGVGSLPVCAAPSDLYANYYDCSFYWKCNQINEPEPFKCPPDTQFDYVTGTCQYIGVANCIGVKSDTNK